MNANSNSNSSLLSANSQAIRDPETQSISSDVLVLPRANSQTTAPVSPVKTKLPSWTDRVLYKTSLKCDQLGYSCINTITISDHKPVYSVFELCVKKIDFKKKQQIYDGLLKESDRLINENMPRIKFEGVSDIKFGDCMFYDAKVMRLAIKNDGVTK
jgi:hypothetical protein